MIGTKEWKKQNGDTAVSVKNRNNDPGFRHNPCGGCNACHTMTSIHPVTDNPIFGGNGDGSGVHWPNLQRPCATNFFQRNLGNSAIQAIAVSRQASGKETSGGSAAVIQRKCACSGSGASCADKEEELGEIQMKLSVGPANDVYEQEADRVAEQIMRMPDSFGQYEDNQSNVGINIQRIATGGDSLNTDSDIQLNINDGQPLSSSTRQFMEPRFGMDFSHVRLHTDHDAHQTASQIQAKAFTYGHQIWLGKGESEQDKGLMAHELTHVVQQTQRKTPDIQLQGGAGRGGAAAAPASHRFAAEGVDIVVRPSCAPAVFSFANVEAATRTALNTIFNMDCIEESRRTRIQRNLRSHGLDIRCRRSVNLNTPGACAESTGFSIPANIFTLGSRSFPGHPDSLAGCQPLESTILHEIVHLTRGFVEEALPASCEASCFGAGGGNPDLCRNIDVFGRRIGGP
ncbi:DUF4157 domain-containing protein [Candidatus Kuenenia sp.]|uniref:eCIS core domain-containing protein n=1 Tax=Candidatus Kuenenia sp. TaxID=2499824 RepID=UPI0032207578